jgi:hypothetical protein
VTETTRPAVTLAKEAHKFDGTDDCPRCLFEAYNYLKRREFTDSRPPGVSWVLHQFGMKLNDCLPDTARQSLVRYLPNGSDPLDGTDGDGRDETRGYMALDWFVRTYLPAFLELHPALAGHATAVRNLARIDNIDTAREAGPVVHAAWDAAWDAAGAAAREFLQPTVTALQESALELYDRMIRGTWDA